MQLDVRSDFSGIAGFLSYLNTASEGIPPDKSISAAVDAVRLYGRNISAASREKYSLIGRVAENFSKLYGFDYSSVGIGESTTHCIHRIVFSKPDVSLVGFPYEEFPGVVQVVASGCRRVGCRIKLYDGGTIEESVKTAIDDGADIVVVSAVSWVTGYRVDLAGLTSYAEKRNAILVVDAVQHFGALTLREGEHNAHAYAASVKKWLLTPHAGLGVCVVSKKILGYQPPFYGLLNLEISDWDSYWVDQSKRALPDQPLRRDGLRFSAPTGITLPSLAGFNATLEYLSVIGIENIEKHIIALKDHLLDLLADNGFETYQDHYPRENHSNIVTIKQAPKSSRRIVEYLAGKRISVSARGQSGRGGVRISLHLYNSYDDIETLVEHLKEAVKAV